MITSIKAEFRKLLTVRSTYFISFIALVLLAFVSFYIEGFKNGKTDLASPSGGSQYLADSLTRHSTVIAIFAAIVSLLLFAHEYRYNTIMYTLTSNKSRSNVLIGKIVVVLLYTFVFTIVAGLAGLGFMILGVHAAGLSMPHQNLALLTYFGKMIFYAEGYALAALLFIALVRNQVAALVILLIEPGTFEGLMSLLLKHNSVYMPFMSLSQVVATPTKEVAHRLILPSIGYLSPAKGALVFSMYLVAGWVVAWILFLKRDAN